MLDQCPQCGQMLRIGWRRCPRCRFLIPQEPADAQAAQAQSPSRPAWLWPVAGGAAVAVLIGLFTLLKSDPAPAPAVTTAAPTRNATGSTPRAQSQPRPVDPVAASAQQAVDSLRSGNAAYAKGDLVGALAQFEAAVAAAPNDPEARNNLGQILVRQGKAVAALPHFDEAVRIMPDNWSYRFNRARAYGALERWTQAVAEYQVAARLFPEDFATHYNLGLALMRLKRYPESVAALEKAVAMAPEEPGFLIQLGTALVAAEQPDRARAVFQQFVERAPNDPEAPRVKALLEAMTAAAK